MYKKNSDVYAQHISSVLEFMYRNRRTSRIEISQATHLTPALITAITNDLTEQGWIAETGDEISHLPGSGRKRKLLTLKPFALYVIGIEINLRGIFVRLTDTLGNALHESCLSFASYDVQNINTEITDQIQTCLHKVDPNLVLGAAIAVPGHFDYTSHTIISNNPLWQSFHLDHISQHFDFPFIVNNNVECMSLGEYLFHPEHCPDKFLFYHIGHGLFCSYFNAEQMGIKENHHIGEVGHTVVDLNGPLCECGKKGCLQTYISESWLIKNAKFLFDRSSNGILRSLVDSPDAINIETIIKAYELGDSYFSHQIDQGIRLLSISIANILIMQDSDKIYLNSKLFEHQAFQAQTIALVEEQLSFLPIKQKIEVKIVDFDPFRGANGACALAVLAFFIKHKNFLSAIHTPKK